MTNIIHVASEANPFSKSGGLAEVAGDLPEAQAARGDTVFVVSPRYKNLRDIPGGWERVELKNAAIEVPFYDSWQDDKKSHDASIEVYKSPKGVYHVLVSPPADHPEYFVNPSDKDDLDKLYRGPDLEKQMAFLCRAALPAVEKAAKSVSKGFKPDVVMGHDWQAGAMGAILRHSPLVPTACKKARFIQVIHNTFD
ncbi:MAG: glycogen/starch synthase, partial [Alphaproteobacteria bacterium]|nr:glycogen/starch synthase [Alphaproteobacteria bacterium]